MLNLAQFRIKNEQIKSEQKRIYRKIFRLICSTINLHAEIGKKFCLFQVPEFFFGEISYPFDECIEYLNNKIFKLKEDKQIIDVSFYEPNVYFIKWKI